MSEPAPLIVFADDWGRHPSSCQHLVARLLPHRHVTWVNTIGTRPPRLNWLTLKRGLEKLRQWTAVRRRSAEPTPAAATPVGSAHPTILNPAMWPSFRSRFARALNRRLLTRKLQPLVDSLSEPPVVVTTLPLVADLIGQFRAARWIYYCVDDFSVWPGLDGRTMRTMEVELVAKVDVAIAVSENLQAHLADLGRPAHLLTHGVDRDFWRGSRQETQSPAWLAELDQLHQPLIVFWGVIDRRLDVKFIRQLGEALKEGIILFVGPQEHPDPELFHIPHIRFGPALRFEELPHLASRAAVFIAPYADLPVTRAMQPLKLKEYIATGKPVVARKLPATDLWADCADVVDTPEAFAAAVMERLAHGVPAEQLQARSRLDAESWDGKVIQFERWIEGKE